MDKGWTPPNRIGPPNPSRLGGGSQMDKGWTWSGSQMDKGLAPPTLHDLEGLPNGQGFGPPNPSRLGVAPKWTRVGPPKSDWTPRPFTTWRVFLSRKRTASVTKFCLYNVPFTLRCRPISRFSYFASSREGVALPKCLSES